MIRAGHAERPPPAQNVVIGSRRESTEINATSGSRKSLIVGDAKVYTFFKIWILYPRKWLTYAL